MDFIWLILIALLELIHFLDRKILIERLGEHHEEKRLQAKKEKIENPMYAKTKEIRKVGD